MEGQLPSPAYRYRSPINRSAFSGGLILNPDPNPFAPAHRSDSQHQRSWRWLAASFLSGLLAIISLAASAFSTFVACEWIYDSFVVGSPDAPAVFVIPAMIYAVSAISSVTSCVLAQRRRIYPWIASVAITLVAWLAVDPVARLLV